MNPSEEDLASKARVRLPCFLALPCTAPGFVPGSGCGFLASSKISRHRPQHTLKPFRAFSPSQETLNPGPPLKALSFVVLSHANAEDDDDPEMLALIENGGEAPEGGAFP